MGLPYSADTFSLSILAVLLFINKQLIERRPVIDSSFYKPLRDQGSETSSKFENCKYVSDDNSHNWLILSTVSLTETKTCLDTSNLAPRQLISKFET